MGPLCFNKWVEVIRITKFLYVSTCTLWCYCYYLTIYIILSNVHSSLKRESNMIIRAYTQDWTAVVDKPSGARSLSFRLGLFVTWRMRLHSSHVRGNWLTENFATLSERENWRQTCKVFLLKGSKRWKKVARKVFKEYFKKKKSTDPKKILRLLYWGIVAL